MKVFQYGGSFNDHDQPAYTGEHEVRCAWHECSNTVSRDNSYSFVISFATRGPDGRLASFTCPDQDEIKMGNWHAQHFCCSVECAAKCAHACVDEHLVPLHQDHVAQLAAYDQAAQEERAAFEAYKAERARQQEAEHAAREELARQAAQDGVSVEQMEAYRLAMQHLAQGPNTMLVSAPAATSEPKPEPQSQPEEEPVTPAAPESQPLPDVTEGAAPDDTPPPQSAEEAPPAETSDPQATVTPDTMPTSEPATAHEPETEEAPDVSE